MALETRTIDRDRKPQKQARCPECDVWGDIDNEQANGDISLICPKCEWYGYINDGNNGGHVNS